MLRLLFSLIVLLGSATSMASERAPHCLQFRDSKLLVEQFEHLYSSDYDSFFATLRSISANALTCKDHARVRCLFELMDFGRNSAEYQEYISEIIERKLFLERPKCFEQAISMMDDKTAIAALRRLANPIHLEEGQAQSVFDRLAKESKNRRLVRLWNQAKSK